MDPTSTEGIAVMEGRLIDFLRRANRLEKWAAGFRSVCQVAAVLLGTALLAVLIDAVLALRAAGLIVVDFLLVVSLVVAGVYVSGQVWRRRYDPRRLARQIEEHLEIGDSRLINAVDLAASPARGSQVLMSQCITEGDELAVTLTASALVDREANKKAMITVSGMLVLALGMLASLPGVFQAVVPRFVHPMAGHPPFTRVKFDVQVVPEKVYHGQRASIRATLGGGTIPSQADVVFVDGGFRRHLPMLRSGEGRFMLRIDRAEQSRRFFIDTPAGRSQQFYLDVMDVLIFERIPGPRMLERTDPIVAEIERFRDRLEELLKQCQVLLEQLGELRTLEVAEALTAGKEQERSALDKELRQYVQHAEQLAEDMFALGQQQPGDAVGRTHQDTLEKLASLVADAAQKLDALVVLSAKAVAGQARSDLESALARSLAQLANAVQQSAQSRGISGGDSQGRSALGPHGQTEESDALVGSQPGLIKPPRGNGPDVEALDLISKRGSRSPVAALSGVPASYRDEAEAYFKRLAEE